MVQDNKKFLQLKEKVGELLADIKRIDIGSFGQSEKEIWEKMMIEIKSVSGEIEKYIFSIVEDLKKTRQDFGKNSDRLLMQASEQLDKVTTSTQKVADNVMNRIEKISEMQNAVQEYLAEIRKNALALGSDTTARSVIESADQIDKKEAEIQVEVYEIMNEMQFQDITSQQIQQVLYLIGEAEGKLMDFGQILAMLTGERGLQSQSPSRGLDFDPKATMADREKRQDLADEIATNFPKKDLTV